MQNISSVLMCEQYFWSSFFKADVH